MNWAELEKRLLAAARKHSPSDSVPYAFEQRVMARLKSTPAIDEWVRWGRALWLGAGACAVITILTSLWSFSAREEMDSADGFTRGIEQTLFASADDADSAW